MRFVDREGRGVRREGRTKVKDLDLMLLKGTIRDAIMCKLLKRGYSYRDVGLVIDVEKSTVFRRYERMSEEDRRALEAMDL